MSDANKNVVYDANIFVIDIPGLTDGECGILHVWFYNKCADFRIISMYDFIRYGVYKKNLFRLQDRISY